MCRERNFLDKLPEPEQASSARILDAGRPNTDLILISAQKPGLVQPSPVHYNYGNELEAAQTDRLPGMAGATARPYGQALETLCRAQAPAPA